MLNFKFCWISCSEIFDFEKNLMKVVQVQKLFSIICLVQGSHIQRENRCSNGQTQMLPLANPQEPIVHNQWRRRAVKHWIHFSFCEMTLFIIRRILSCGLKLMFCDGRMMEDGLPWMSCELSNTLVYYIPTKPMQISISCTLCSVLSWDANTRNQDVISVNTPSRH